MTPAMLGRLRDAQAGLRAIVLATRLPDGTQRLLPDDGGSAALCAAAENALRRDQSRTAEIDSETWFLRVYAPAPHLIVVGAVHIAQSLAPLASPCGYAVTVVDPRRAFATAERFPGVALHHAWPDEALAALAPDRRTAVVTLTHDPKLDDPALIHALRSEAFYVGALGSRRTQAARRQRLAAAGLAADALDRVRGPVGLALNAVSAPEIAVSIIAEIIAVRRGGTLAAR